MMTFPINVPEIQYNLLTVVSKTDYSIGTKATSLVGIDLPFNTKAYNRQLIAGFFMRSACAYLYYGGLVKGTQVRRFLGGGSLNLDQSTTNRLRPLGGGYKNHIKEATL